MADMNTQNIPQANKSALPLTVEQKCVDNLEALLKDHYLCYFDPKHQHAYTVWFDATYQHNPYIFLIIDIFDEQAEFNKFRLAASSLDELLHRIPLAIERFLVVDCASDMLFKLVTTWVL